MERSHLCIWPLVLTCLVLVGDPISALIRMNDPLYSEHHESAEVTFDLSRDFYHSRRKRDTARNNLPQTVRFGVRTPDGAETRVELEQHERTDEVTPVFLLENGRVDRLDQNDDPNWALYTDDVTNAVFLVHREEDMETLTLNGMLTHNGKTMQLRPDYEKEEAEERSAGGRVKRSSSLQQTDTLSSGTYRIAETPMFFGADALKMTKPPTYEFDPSYFSMGNSINVTVANRRRRINNIVEVCLSIDSSDYTKFLNNSGGNAVTAVNNIIQWYTFMELTMNCIFDTFEAQSTEHDINVRFTGIVIATMASETPWYNDIVDANGKVDNEKALRAWGVAGPDLFPIADNYISMTGLDIQWNGNSGVAGTAFLSGMCSAINSAQISENVMSVLTALIMSHEMGHNLAARHDSLVGCNDADQFIMSAILGPVKNPANAMNPWTFSSCSAAAIEAKLDNGSSNCLRMTSCPRSAVGSDQLPGQALDVDQQCKLFYGPSSAFCRETYADNNLDIEDNMCYLFFCRASETTCMPIIAFDYTSCGNQKWCIKGKCVGNAAAPPRFDDCPAGDVPGQSCTGSTVCSLESSRRRCCETCALRAGNTLAPFVPPVTNPATTAPPNSLCHTAVTSPTAPTSPTSPTPEVTHEAVSPIPNFLRTESFVLKSGCV